MKNPPGSRRAGLLIPSMAAGRKPRASVNVLGGEVLALHAGERIIADCGIRPLLQLILMLLGGALGRDEMSLDAAQ